MQRHSRLAFLLILALMWQSLFSTRFTPMSHAAAALPLYTVIDLGTLGGSISYAQAINSHGEIVGASSLPGDPTDPVGNPIFHAFLYRNGQITDLGTLGGATSFANAINQSGQVAGNSFMPGNPTTPYGDFVFHGFLYNGSAKIDLGTLGGPFGSSASGINDSGQVVGQADSPSGRLRGFIYENGVMQEIPTPTSDYTIAYAINNGGLIVGTWAPHGSTAQYAFTYDTRSMTPQLKDLGTLGGNFCQAISVNDTGWVVGESSLPGLPDSESLHAFLYQGSMLDLGTLPGDTYSSAAHINAAGQVVGWSVTADFSTYRGFLWSNGVMQDLNTLIAADSGWQITFASGINDLGQIVGSGLHNGQQHAVLLIPPTQVLNSLASLVQSFNPSQGITNALLAKLQNVYTSVNAGNFAAACNQLSAFINQVSAQSGRALTVAQANQLLAVAAQLRMALGC